MIFRERKQRIAAKRAAKEEEQRRLDEERKEQECMCPAVTHLLSSFHCEFAVCTE